MSKKSIATRWFVNSFSIVAVLLLILDITVFFSIQNYYYNAVSQYIQTEANIVAGVLVRFYDGSSTNYSSEIRNAVEEFDKKNSMELGVGFATDTGPHVQIGWTKPWINSRGHSFRTNLYVSAPKQNFEATYKMPLLKNPLNYYYEFSTGYEKENKNDTDTKALTFAALRYWNNSEGWQYFAGLRVRYDSYTQADFTDKTFLVYPTGGFNRTRLRGGQFPTWGDTQKITVDLGNKLWMSEANFFKIQASTAWIRTYAENHRFITRAEIGYLNTADIRKIPPALRFFAGGDRSVRGYGYKKISPKNKDGKLVGGSRLVTGSLEYQYQVYPNWWGAVFADTGLAADAYKANELRYGAGFGVRWASPVGAIKFDIATPIRDKDNSKNIQFYIGLGAEI